MPEYVVGDRVRLVLSCPDTNCSYCTHMNGALGTLVMELNDKWGYDWLIEVDNQGRGFFNPSEFEHAGEEAA